MQSDVKRNSYVRAVIKQEMLPPQAVETLRLHFESKDCILMEAVRDVSGDRKKCADRNKKDIRTLSLEELFAEFYSYQQNGSLPDGETEKLIAFAAEQTRNGCSSDETETGRKQAAMQLIEYAVKCRNGERRS